MLTLPELRRRCAHLQSAALPANPHQALAQRGLYTKALAPYAAQGSRTEFNSHNPNLGWKIHLNVPVANVAAVSDHLRSKNYFHKFLLGGELEHGKVFTVYLGSAEFAQEEARRISGDIGELFSQPVDTLEAEFAPGVVARFVDPTVRGDRGLGVRPPLGQNFLQYGSAGIVYDEMFNPYRLSLPGKSREQLIAMAEEHAFAALEALHGAYFTGAR